MSQALVPMPNIGIKYPPGKTKPPFTEYLALSRGTAAQVSI